MKYVLYRFPNAVRYSDTSDPELYDFFKFPVQGQIVGVEFGSSIEDVTDELVQDVNDELAGAYPKCQVMTYAPSDEMFGLEILTKPCIRMAFPPLHLLPMTPPLSPLTRPLQSIILSRLPGWRTMKRYLARSTASI